MIFFRADGNSKIGIGHIMRSMTIAKAAISQNEEVLFITADNEADDILDSNNIPHLVMNSDYTDMLTEKNQIKELADEYHPSLIVVDSYFVSDEYFGMLSNLAKTAYIDDLCQNAYDVDILINYNIQAKKEDYEALYADKKHKPQMLLGTDYVPVRDMFISAKSTKEISKDHKAKNILLLTGGADPLNLSEIFALEWISREAACKDIVLNIVCGPFYTEYDKLCGVTKGVKNIILHQNVQNMAKLMEEADLAIASSGSTIYELCAVGVPTIAFYFIDNQKPVYDEFVQRTPIVGIGDFRQRQDGLIKEAFDTSTMLLGDDAKRNELSKALSTIIDGNGAQRIAKSLISFI